MLLSALPSLPSDPAQCLKIFHLTAPKRRVGSSSFWMLVNLHDVDLHAKQKKAEMCPGTISLPDTEVSCSTTRLSPTRHGAAVTADMLDERVRLLEGAELST